MLWKQEFWEGQWDPGSGVTSVRYIGTRLQREPRPENTDTWPDVCMSKAQRLVAVGWGQSQLSPDVQAQRLLLRRLPESQPFLAVSTSGPSDSLSLLLVSGSSRLTTVARLGMCLTEFSTSSSVTSTSVQFSSSDGNGSAPCLVTQGCSFNESQEW